ncbi:protein-S-isoprenylcysteine O-methyltransferase Ste14 [Anaerobacterium chartisolvens]|uniref:Protein-S-isoprenylcysteine O-methyltransferase Ste14 n=2 Tax=Anaerobacterium chartisolvens TaxID=1297424 RepID=A0A369B4M4_9FIRM|nr:protein-S-isoprenylcysteine O-methyltransferase Ste14 [Anaerobacterium chartisolvens]
MERVRCLLLILTINFLTMIIYSYFLSSDEKKAVFLKIPIFLQKLLVFGAVGPLFVSTIVQQPRINFGTVFLKYLFGGIFILLGSLTIISAFRRIGAIPSLKQKSKIISSGAYSLVRHPIYSGTLIVFLGLIVLFEALIPLLYFPLSTVLYYILIRYEEKELIKEYGDEYIEYSKKVKKKIIPFII